LSRHSQDPQGDRYVCLWSPCGSTRTFGRVAELQRHYAQKHIRSKVYECTALGCLARGDKGFTRVDKLRLHVETCHNENTLFFCAIARCHDGPFTPDLLKIHTRNHDPVLRNQYSGEISGLYSTVSGQDDPRCPIVGCEKPIRHHRSLLRHDLDTRNRNMSAILTAGFNPTSGLLLCPICNADLELGWWDGSNKKHFLDHEHELGSLYEYRRWILKAWPDFGTYKVFDDVLPTVDRSRIRF